MKAYLVRSTARGSIALLRDWALIGLVAYLNIHYPSWYLYLPSIWVIGAFQFAIGEGLLHEASHHNLFRQRRLNYDLEFLYALPFLLTVRQFRANHLVHHNSLGRKSDQLTADYRQLGLLRPGASIFYLWFIKPLVGQAAWYYVRLTSLRPLRTEGVKLLVFWAAVVTVFTLTGRVEWLVKFWLIPLFWSYYAYLYWSEVSDHFYALSGTRSNLSRLTNWVTHNNGYHYVHHKYPTIPWYKLREAYAQLLPDVGDISHGFLDTYRQIVRNRQTYAAMYASGEHHYPAGHPGRLPESAADEGLVVS